jgi:molecular chaperone DnaK
MPLPVPRGIGKPASSVVRADAIAVGAPTAKPPLPARPESGAASPASTPSATEPATAYPHGPELASLSAPTTAARAGQELVTEAAPPWAPPSVPFPSVELGQRGNDGAARIPGAMPSETGPASTVPALPAGEADLRAAVPALPPVPDPVEPGSAATPAPEAAAGGTRPAVVALAAARLATPMSDRAPLLLDVTPHTLGLESVGGYYEILIERNSAIPVDQSRVFTTGQDDQRSVSIRIFQGESRRVADNQHLGQLELSGLRPGPRGSVKLAVTFVLDADGTLAVRAQDMDTGREQATRIRLLGGVGEEEIARMVERQARLMG